MSKDDTTLCAEHEAEHEHLLAEVERLRAHAAVWDPFHAIRDSSGNVPLTAEGLNQVVAVLADMSKQIGALQWRVHQLESFNGIAPLPPLEPRYHPIDAAAEILGYSPADLRKHIERWEKTGGYLWWTERDGQLFVDVKSNPLPRMVRK